MHVWQDEALSACGVSAADRVLVALSGGADSVALFLEAIRLRDEGKIGGVGAAHLNHGIRGEEANRDAAFCKALCAERDIPFYCGSIDIPEYAKAHRLSLETAARAERYRFLRETASRHEYSLIAAAHHKDDQAETLLLHLIRGCGTDGLNGMRPREGNLIRPLLGVSKSEILAFLAERGQAYCTDSTNESTDALRNRVRHTVLPALAACNPAISDALARTCRWTAYDSEYLNRLADEALRSEPDRFAIRALDPAIRFRVFRRMLPYDDVTHADLETLDALLSAQTGSVRQLRFGYAAWTGADRLYIGKPDAEAYCKPLPFDETVAVPNGTVLMHRVERACFPCPANEAYLDAAAIQGAVTVRTPIEGDRFRPFGMRGTKLLSDCFTDRKIPRHQRGVPIVCDEEGILFVAGYTIDERARITASTKDTVHIIFKEDGDHVG